MLACKRICSNSGPKRSDPFGSPQSGNVKMRTASIFSSCGSLSSCFPRQWSMKKAAGLERAPCLRLVSPNQRSTFRGPVPNCRYGAPVRNHPPVQPVSSASQAFGIVCKMSLHLVTIRHELHPQCRGRHDVLDRSFLNSTRHPL